MLHLITGGAGFLGSHLANALVNDGQKVIIIDNMSTGHVRNLEQAISTGRATLIFGDVAKPYPVLAKLLASGTKQRIDRIYHLASPSGPKAYVTHPWSILEVNALGTMSLIELALEQRARLMFASSSAVYGDPLVHPQSEGYFGNVDPVGPRSCYEESKRFGEAAVATATRSRGLDACIIRFFHCYGPRMDDAGGRLIPELFAAANAGLPLPIHGTGEQRRSLTYALDAIQMVRAVMESSDAPRGPINVGSDEEYSVAEIAQTVARVAGVPYRPVFVAGREGDPQRRKPELTYARSFGALPNTPLEEGLRATQRWLCGDRLTFA